MISVVIYVNGRPIFTRSAVNKGLEPDGYWTRYAVDDGSEILHHREAGAVPLAIAMLDKIKEPR